MAPEEPKVFSTFLEALDYKPAFQVIALFCPVGLHDVPTSRGRRCERDARAMLGRPRASAITSAPARAALKAATYKEAAEANGGRLGAVSWRMMGRIAEIDANVAPYWQRTVFEVHPELSFLQLNDDRPVRYSKHTAAGREERAALLRARIPGLERIIEAKIRQVSLAHLLDAAACLWTSRRVVSRAVERFPRDPEWDAQGLRMEFVR